jgi:hypothetical protein
MSNELVKYSITRVKSGSIIFVNRTFCGHYPFKSTKSMFSVFDISSRSYLRGAEPFNVCRLGYPFNYLITVMLPVFSLVIGSD